MRASQLAKGFLSDCLQQVVLLCLFVLVFAFLPNAKEKKTSLLTILAVNRKTILLHSEYFCFVGKELWKMESS